MLTIDENLFKLGLRLKDKDNNTHILVHIKLKQESNNQHEYCLTFRQVVNNKECSNCGYVDTATISPYCPKCYLSYSEIPNNNLINYGLHE